MMSVSAASAGEGLTALPPPSSDSFTLKDASFLSSIISISGTQSSSAATLANGSSTGVQDVLESLWPYQVSLAAWRYVPPFILALGTLGNVMTLRVLSASSARSSAMPIYFRALAVSDLTLLYAGLLRQWLKYTFHLEIRDTHAAVCKIDAYLVYVTGMTSAWFLVMMTTQRALSVVWPHKMSQVSGRRTAGMAVAVVVVVGCLMNAHILYGYDVRYNPQDGHYYCDNQLPSYEHFLRVVWPWIDSAFYSLLPFCALLASNSLLMRTVTSSVKDVKKLTSEGQRSQEVVSQRQKMSTSLNATLIFLSATFFLLTSPMCLFLLLDYYLHFLDFHFLSDLPGGLDLNHLAAANLAYVLANLLWYLNSAVNFYLYCLTGSRFRSQVRQCLCCALSARGTD